jgi:hypothetical protein
LNERLECVKHVQKRMDSFLRKLDKDYRGKKVEDGRFLTGKSRLTAK